VVISRLPRSVQRAVLAVLVLWCLSRCQYAVSDISPGYSVKPGVDIQSCTEETKAAFHVMARVFAEHGQEMVITSGAEPYPRLPGSKHPEGNAVDLRSKHMSISMKFSVLKSLRSHPELQDFDILLENIQQEQEHFHVERDPRH